MKKTVLADIHNTPECRDRLRAAFMDLVNQKGMTLAQVARDAGFKRPNLLYNFINGHTEQFSQETLRRLSKALDVPVSKLMGVEPNPAAAPLAGASTAHSSGLIVRASTGVGDWRDSFDLPLEAQFRSRLLVEPSLLACGAFGVVVRGRGCELLYREGTVLGVVPITQWDGSLVAGRRVVLQRIRDRVEVTVREIEVRDGHAWLWPRSNDPSDPACLLPIEMPWPVATGMWRRDEDRFLIAGVVVEALVPEP